MFGWSGGGKRVWPVMGTMNGKSAASSDGTNWQIVPGLPGLSPQIYQDRIISGPDIWYRRGQRRRISTPIQNYYSMNYSPAEGKYYVIEIKAGKIICCVTNNDGEKWTIQSDDFKYLSSGFVDGYLVYKIQSEYDMANSKIIRPCVIYKMDGSEICTIKLSIS